VLQKGMGRAGTVLLGMEGLRGGDEGRGSCDWRKMGREGGRGLSGGRCRLAPVWGLVRGGDDIIVSRSCMAVFARAVLVLAQSVFGEGVQLDASLYN
jgi:hypothetical protein